MENRGLTGRSKMDTAKLYPIISKMMPPQNQSMADIAKETGLSEATLFNVRLERKALLYQVERPIASVGVRRTNSQSSLKPPS